MPTYTYECKKCGHSQDLFHSMSTTPRVKCEQCGGSCARLLGKGAGIIFKGSGFYETDYKRKGKAPASESASPAKTESKAESKSESKTSDAASKPAASSSAGESKGAAPAKAS